MKLGMPTNIRAEDGTRESYQLAFGKMDNDGSKSIDVHELLRFCGHRKRRSHSGKSSRRTSAAPTPARSGRTSPFSGSGGGGKDGGGGDHEKKRKLTFLEIKEIFATLDRNGDGDITHAEFITGMKKNPWVATKLGMPTNVRQEDGTRESYQLSFGKIDNDNSKSIQFSELCRFFGYYEDGELVTDWSEQSGDSFKSYISGSSRTAVSTPMARAHTAPIVAPTAPPVFVPPPPAAAKSQGGAAHAQLTALEVINMFKTLDRNGDGELSHAEFLKGIKMNPLIGEKLGMPKDVRAEDGTRDSYQLAFGQIDNDGSKTIDLSELLEFYGHLNMEKTQLSSLLMLCGYDSRAIRLIFGRAGMLSASVSSVSSVEVDVDINWAPGADGALTQVSREARRAEMLRKKKRELFLKRMAAESPGMLSASSQGLMSASGSVTGTPMSASGRSNYSTGSGEFSTGTGTGTIVSNPYTPGGYSTVDDQGSATETRLVERENKRLSARNPSAASLLNNPEQWLSSTEQRLQTKDRRGDVKEQSRLSRVGEERLSNGRDREALGPRGSSGTGGTLVSNSGAGANAGQDTRATSGADARKSTAGSLRMTDRAMPSRDEQEADLIFDEAASHWENGEYSQAEAKYKHALRLDPNHVLTLCSYGVLLYDVRRDHERAEKMYKRALNLDPQNVNTLCNYGWLLHDVRRDHDAAEQLYKQSLRLDPNHVMTLCNYGALLHEYLHDIKGDLVDVEKMYEKALRIDPNHIDTLNNYGLLLHKTKHDYDGAEEMYRRVLRLDNNQVDTLCSYALLLKEIRHDMPHAKQLVRRAQSLDPQHPWLQQNAEAFAH
jgi:Tfp pilus assembly protein PilF/Ca2+-binding EF-hand superfamily protein